MQYNKQQFNKVNDKKIMKKVKKQWVVVSVASLAVLGGFAVSGTLNMSQPASSVVAHAAENNGATAQNNNADKTADNGATAQNNNADKTADNGATAQNNNADKTADNGATAQNNNANKTADNGATAQNNNADKAANNGATAQNNNADKTANNGATAQNNNADKTANNGATAQNNNADKTADNGATAQNNNANKTADNGATAQNNNANKTADNGATAQNNNADKAANNGATAQNNNADKTANNGATAQNNNADKTADNGATAQNNNADKTADNGATAQNNNQKPAIYTSKYLNDNPQTFNYNDLNSLFGQNVSSNAFMNMLQANPNNVSQNQADQGAIAAWNSIHSDDTQNSDQSISTNTDAYKAGYRGVVDAWNKYNELNSKKGTQATDDYTRANLNGKTPNDPNSVNPNLNSGNNSFTVNNDKDKAQIPNDPNAGKQTSNELNNNNKVVTSTNNISDNAVNNYNNQVTFDKNNNIQITDDNQTYYNQGVTDFLKYQGAYDAENGRWNSKNINDAYNPDPDSQNAYDQSYRGAQDAINQQFKNDNTFSYNQTGQFNPTNNDSSNNPNYTQGFNDVKNQVNNNGAVYVSNPLQIQNAIIGPTNSAGSVQTSNNNGDAVSSSTIYSDQTTKSIKFLNDISYQNTGYYSASGETNVYVYTKDKSGLNISLDGQNHSGDFGQISYRIDNNNDNLSVQNFNALYGINFYGPANVWNDGTSGNINYKNVTYVGPQLAYATSATVNVYGNLNVFGVGNYKGPGRSFYTTTEGSGYANPVYTNSNANSSNSLTGNNQDNFQVKSFNMQSGGNYYGTTNGSTVMDLQSGGNLTANSNSRMRLVPLNNSSVGSESSPNSNAVGLYLQGGNAYINKNAIVEIDPQTNSNSVGIAQGIYNSGTINIDGGKLIVNDDGALTSNSEYANYSGNINVKNGGLLKVTGTNMGASQRSVNDLLYSNGVNISNRGNLDIHTDGTYGTGNLNLLYLGGSFDIDNPGNQVSLQIDNNGKGNLFANGTLNGYSVKYAVSQNSLNNGGQVYTSDPAYQVQVTSDGQISYTQLKNGSYSLVNDNDSNHSAKGAKYLSFDSTPNAFFDGPINVANNQGYYVNGKLKLANLPSNVVKGQAVGDNGRVYIQVSSDGNNLSNDDIKNSIVKLVHSDGTSEIIPYSDISEDNNLSHSGDNNSLIVPSSNGSTQSSATSINNTYTDSIRLPESVKNGDEIQFSYKLNSKPSKNVTVQSTYFVMSQKQVLNSDGSVTSSLENPLKGTDPIDTSAATGSMVAVTTSSASSDGINDGINDAGLNQNSADQPINGSNWPNYSNSNNDIQNAYKNSYTDAYNGYNQGKLAYDSGTYNPSNYNSSSNTDANKKGYIAYGNQIKNGFNNKINNVDSKNKSDGYVKGQGMAQGVQNTLKGQTQNNKTLDQNNGQKGFNDGWTTSNNIDDNQNATNPAYHYGIQMKNGFNDSKDNSSQNQPNHDKYDGNIDAYNSDKNAYQNGQNSYNGMNDVLSNQPQGTNDKDGNKNGSDAYNVSYNAAKAGLNSDTNQTPSHYDNKQQQTVYDNGRAVRTGINDALSGNQNPTIDKFSDKDQSDNYSKAFEAARHGFDGNNDSQPTNDDQQQLAAYNSGKSAKQGTGDAVTGTNAKNDPNSDYTKNWSQPQRDAYDNAQAAYKAGLNGNQTDADKTAAAKNDVANQAGLAAKQGTGDAVTGTNAKNDPNSDYTKNWSQPQRDAYDNAQAAYKAGLNGNQTDADKTAAAKNDVANQAGLAAKQGTGDAVTGTNAKNDPNSDYTKNWSQPQRDAYDNAQAAYKAGLNGNQTDADKAAAAKNDVANQAGLAAKQGTGDAVTGTNAKNDPNSDYTKNWSQPQRDAYDNAQAAYKAGLNGNQTDADKTAAAKNDVANQAGLAAKQGTGDAVTGTNAKNDPNSDYTKNWSQPQRDAYDNAQAAYKAGLNGNQTDADKAAAAKNDVANQAGLAAKQGTGDAVTGTNAKNDPNSDYTKNWSQPQRDAYDNAQAAYKAGLNGNQTDADKAAAAKNDVANQAGLAAKQGTSDAVTGTNAKNDPNSDYTKNWSQPQRDAYDNAQAAYKAGLNGNQTDADKAAAAKNDVANQVGLAAKQGTGDAVTGTNAKNDPNSDYTKNWSQPQRDAYDNAQAAYKAGLNGNQTDADKTVAAKNDVANQAGLAAKQGTGDAVTGTNAKNDPNSDYTKNWSQPQRDAYDNAQAAYKAGLNGNQTDADKAAAAKNDVANQAGLAAKQGTGDAVTGTNAKNDPNSDYTKNWSQPQRDAYDNAQAAYKAGLNGNQTDADKAAAAKNDVANQAGLAAKQGTGDAVTETNAKNDPNSDYTKNWSQPQRDAYDNAQAAYKAGLNGNQTDADKAAAAKNDVANQAGLAAKQGTGDAVTGTNAKNDPNSDYTKNWSQPQRDAYDNAQAAYKAGLNGNQTDADKAAAAKNDVANQAGLAAKQGTGDAVTGTNAKNDPNSDYTKNWSQPQRDAYDNAQAAYKAGLNGNQTDADKAAAAKNDVANQAGLAAKQGTGDAVTGTNAKNDPNSDYTKNWSQPQRDAYDNAQAAYKAGLNGNQTDADKAAAAKNDVANQAGLAAKQGTGDAVTGTNAKNDPNSDYTKNWSQPQRDAYDNAQAAYKAGLNGNQTDADKAAAAKNDVANQAGLAAKQGTGDAVTGTNAKNDPNSDYTKNWSQPQRDAYDNAQAAFNAGLNGQPNTDKNYQLNPTAGQAGQAAQAGIADGIGGKPSDNNYQNDPSYQQAYKDSQLARQGANDAINGNPENSSDKDNPAYDNAYKAVKNNTNLNGQNKTLPNVITQAAQAAQQGRKDAQNGNNLADSKNKNDANNPYYNGQWTPTQKQNYDNAQIAYNAGNNGDTTSNNAKKNYDANQNGYNNYLANQSSQPVSPNNNDDTQAGQKAGQQAFIGGNPLNINSVNLSGKSQAFKNAFTKAYNDSQAGFDAGLNGNNDNSDNSSFNAGYKSAQDYKQGVSDATDGKKPAINSSDAYKIGYNAYKDGISGKDVNKDTLDKLAPAYRSAYENNYQAAHKEYVAVSGKASSAAKKDATGNKSIPRGLKHESSVYQTAYMEAFNRYVKDNLPSYVYNLKKIYSHDAPALTRHTRVNKYAKTPRYARHAFKVLGYKITSSGHVVYKVRGLGWISASDKSVDNLYYRRHDTKKPIQKIRVIKPQGTYIYNNKTFNKKTAVKKMKRGSVVKVERIEKVGSITRFYIGDGKYISSNKTIVEHVR